MRENPAERVESMVAVAWGHPGLSKLADDLIDAFRGGYDGHPRGIALGDAFAADVAGNPFAIPIEIGPVEIKDEDGTVIFTEPAAEFPATWDATARQIVASRYFYGDHEQGFRETSLLQVVFRVSARITLWAMERRTFASVEDAYRFFVYLSHMQINQQFAFNSPVYFNVGADCYGEEQNRENYYYDTSVNLVRHCRESSVNRPQISACFIQSVEDDMGSIMALATSEAMLFKRGSGTGTDLSTLRSFREKLSGGGKPSGPVSFMRVYDSIASIIKSGGRVRRAAKMQTLKYWHPDIMEFVRCKSGEERKARALIAAGYEANFNGEAYSSIAFQNANLSVRVDGALFEAADAGLSFTTHAVTTHDVIDSIDASEFIDTIAECAWFCGDPGLQFEDRIQEFHTVKAHGPINSSNPCIRIGSRLLTGDGWRKVESLAGQDVEIFDGIGFVKGKVWRSGRKSIVRVHLNSGEQIDLTSDHRIYTTDGWVVASESEGKTVPRALPNVGSTGGSLLPRAITGASGRFYNHAAIDLLESLGFIQGDGGLRAGIMTVYYTPEKDADFVDESVLPIFQDIAANKGEIDYKASPIGDGRSGYAVSRSKLIDWLEAIGFEIKPLPERDLPSFVWGVKQNAQAAFLRGLFGANGNILKDSRRAVNLISTCRKMLAGVQLLLRGMGIVSAIRVHNKTQEIEWANGTYTSKESYRLEITHQSDIATFARLIGFPQESQRAKLRLIVGDKQADNRDGGFAKRAFANVIKVENLGIEDDVYDFSAPTTSMGMCDGFIVHNCSEYMHIDNSACNLASINVMRFRVEAADDPARVGDDTYEPYHTPAHFDVDRFRRVCTVATVAMETMVGAASYPTEKIALNSHRFRPIGGGYANVGTYCMVSGFPYDSAESRATIAAFSSLLTGAFYVTSGLLARRFGPFDAFAANRESMMDVMRLHREHAAKIPDPGVDSSLIQSAKEIWDEVLFLGDQYGFRNSQATCIAPTGTIAFMMGCDTLGIEPEIALVRFKSLAGRGVLKLVNRAVLETLRNLDYFENEIDDIVHYIEKYNTIEDVVSDVAGPDGTSERRRSGLAPGHLPIFDCAFPPAPVTIDGREWRPSQGRSIGIDGHVKMISCATPFISGAISKTVNLPSHATPGDIRKVYYDAWKLGCKAIAVYRDGSKGSQPITTQEVKSSMNNGESHIHVDSTTTTNIETDGQLRAALACTIAERDACLKIIERMESELAESRAAVGRMDAEFVGGHRAGSSPRPNPPVRFHMPGDRNAHIHKFNIVGHEGFIIRGFTPDGGLGEVFIEMSKQGSTIAGLMDVIGILMSMSLQYNVPVAKLVEKMEHQKFNPAGITTNKQIKFCSSVIDYVGRYIGVNHVPGYAERMHPVRADGRTPAEPMGLGSVDDAIRPTKHVAIPDSIATGRDDPRPGFAADINNDPCPSCGSIMVRQGMCMQCFSCGYSDGGCGG